MGNIHYIRWYANSYRWSYALCLCVVPIYRSELGDLIERRKHLEADISALRDERAVLAADIPEGPLALYERLLKSKGGMAVAPMQEGRCGGCHMKLIPATVIKVQSGKEFAQCEDCARILYLGE